MSHFFDSSKYVISRAKHHISDFERQNVEFFATNPYSQVVEIDPDTGDKIHKVKLIKPMPIALPGIAFDAVNNLRSALDQAMYGMTLAAGVKRAYFPFSNNAANFQNSVNGWCKELPKEIGDIVSTFEAYKGGNNMLWSLNQVCNTNKHGIICPVALQNSSFSIHHGVFTGRFAGLRVPFWDRAKNEMELFRVPEEGTAEVNFDFTTFIAMRDVEFVDGQPAIAVLSNFFSIVERIVMALETESRRIGLI